MAIHERRDGWARITRRPNKTSIDDNEAETGWAVDWTYPERTAPVKYNHGATVCLGGYEFARVSVTFTGAVASPEVRDNAYSYMKSVVLEVIAREKAGIQNTDRVPHSIPEPEVQIFKRELTVEYGLTLSQPNKGYGKADVYVGQPIGDGDSIEEAVTILQGWIEERISAETPRLKGQAAPDADLGF